MRKFFALPFVIALAGCSSAPPAADPAAPAPLPAPVVAPSPAPDAIGGQVVGEDPMFEVSKHADVKLKRGDTEVASMKADENGNYKFTGPFEKGRYEILVHDGKLHGSREITFNGGDMSGVTVLVTDGKGDHHRRRRRHRH